MKELLNLSDVQFRKIEISDSIVEINSLLLSAYRPLAEAGMRYAASHEDAEATKKNIEEGECYLGIYDKKIVACVVLRASISEKRNPRKDNGPNWYKNNNVATFGRFAVSPTWQGKGLGSKMMDLIENQVRDQGFTELALDTSEHAKHLIDMYDKRSYRFIEFHQWEITNYRSVVMSKTLKKS